MRRSLDVLALVACLVLAAVTLGLAWAPAAPPAAGAQVTDVLTTTPAPPAAQHAAPAREQVPVPQSATVSEQPAAPVRIEITSLDISAEVVPVGVQDDGAFDVPDDGDLVGWYRYGSTPGAAAGSAVLAGHVDTAAGGEGALFPLAEVEPGAQVVVTDADGRRHEFAVAARETIRKSELPVELVFSRDGPPRLTLVTCGGPFDAERRRYRDNVVVVAVPAAEGQR